MPERQEFGVGVQSVATKRSRRVAWIAAVLVPLGLVCVVAFALLGADRRAIGVNQATPALQSSSLGAFSVTQPPTATPQPSAPLSTDPIPLSGQAPVPFAMAAFGYGVANDPSAVGPPIVEQGGRVVVFRSGAWPVPDGHVAVGVGTQAEATRIFGSDDSIRVYGTTLSGLERDFRLKSRDRVVSSVAIRVDDVPARLLAVESFPPEIRWVALVVYSGRSYVIAAWGFSSLYPGNLTSATRSGLIDFLRRFQFVGRTASAGPP